MKKLPILLALAAALAVAGCDNNVPPTNAPVDQNPQVDKNPVPKSTTGGDQTGTPATAQHRTHRMNLFPAPQKFTAGAEQGRPC